MTAFLTHLFDTSGFPPRWECGSWTEAHGWLHILSDLGIWSAYFAIPCILVFFVLRRRDVPFPSIFWLFGAFILACGTTHLMEVIIFWHPLYRLAGVIKVLTAIVSWATVAALVPMIPKALAMRSPEELEREIAARKQAEDALHRTNAELEVRVQERTAELARANATLRYEREMLRITLTSIGDGVVTTDTASRVMFLNPVAEALTGWKQAEAAGVPLRTVFNIINEQSRQPVEDPTQKALREGTAVGLANHTVLIAKDASERPIEDSAAPIRDQDGQVVGVVLVFRDATERRRLEHLQQNYRADLERQVRERTEQLRTTEERFRLLVDGTQDHAIFMLDPTGRVVSWNPGAERIKQYRADEIIGQHFACFYPAADVESGKPDQELQVAVAAGKYDEEGWRVRKDGTPFWASVVITALRDDTGNLRGFSKVTRDITERKMAEENARRLLREEAARRAAEEHAQVIERQREQLRVTLTSIGDGVVTTDAEGRVTFLNPVAEALTGWTNEDAAGQPLVAIFRIVNERTRQTVENPVAEVLTTGSIVGLANHTVLIAKDGTERPIDDSAAPIKDNQGLILGCVLVFHDVSQQRQAEMTLRQSEERFRLAQQVSRLGTFDWNIVENENHWSPELLALYGIRPEEFEGTYEAWLRRLHSDDAGSAEEEIRESLVSGRYDKDFRVIWPDGSVHWLHGRAKVLYDEAGHPTRMVGINVDITERKQAEERLRRATEQLHIVTESMSAPITRCSRDLRYLWVSKPYADWLARPADEIIGRPIREIIGEQAFEHLHPHFAQVLAGQVVRYEEQVPFQGIGPRWINAVYTPTLDADGVPDGWVAVVIDISDRKRMEEALRASEERLALELDAMTRLHALGTRLLACADLRMALEDVLDGAMQTTRADFGNIQLFNPENMALEIAVQRGFRQDFLDYFRTVRVDDGSACAQAMQCGERIIIQDVQLDPAFESHRSIAAAADYRTVQSTPLKSRSGPILGMLSTHFRKPHRVSERDQRLLDLYARHAADFLERLRFEEALRDQAEAVQESERRERERAAELEAILRTTPTPIWIAHDPQCQRITGNPASFKLLGLPEDVNVSATASGRGFQEYQDDKPIPAAELPMQVAVAKGLEVNGVEVKFVFDDGHVRYIYGNAVPLRDGDGKVRGAIGAFADVTPLKEAEATLKEADRRKDEFLATLAHELRGPLAPIRNSLQLLRLADGNREVLGQARAMIERQVQQMVRLVDDLLDVSRITSGKLQLRKERVLLAVVIQSAIELARPLIEAQSHELSITLPDEPVYLDADGTRLSQVISNLLNNAAKYTEKGGRIWLTAQRQGSQVAVSVRDTGIGIPAEHLAQIFEMFSQVAPALERSHGGLGIGLNLVRGLVQLHGGTVEAHSNPGKGSEFIVHLPMVEEPLPLASEKTGENQPAQRQATFRILVVDDNRDAADSLAMMLRLLGHDIQTAHDGVEAVQAAAAFRPDVALLDIGMPKMNGYQTARHIREQPWGKRMVLIALTGWGQEEDKRLATEAGFHYHLTKPVEPGALEKLLEGLTQPRR